MYSPRCSRVSHTWTSPKIPSKKKPAASQQTPQKRRARKAQSALAEQSVVVRAPIQISRVITRRAEPRFRSVNRNGDILVCHREYFSDIATTTAFAATMFVVNPGNAAMFPWLASIARNFESYKFQKLRIQYRTGESTTSHGRIGMYVDYDCLDAPPASKQAAYSNRGCVDGPVWNDLEFKSLGEDLSKRKSYYVSGNQAGVPGTIAENLADVGNLFIFTSADASPDLIGGEMFVEYECLLMTPASPAGLTQSDTALTTANAGVASATPLGTSFVSYGNATSAASDNILEWASATAVRFVSTFVGQMVIEFSSATALTAVPPAGGGTGTTATSSYEQVIINAAATASNIIYNISGGPGDFWTFIGMTAATLGAVRIRMYATRPGL